MPVYEVRVSPAEGMQDPRADRIIAQAAHELGQDLTGLSTTDVYYLEGDFPPEALDTLADELLSNPVVNTRDTAPREDWTNPNAVEVTYHPQVEDPKTVSIVRGATLFDVEPTSARTGVEYHFPDHITPDIVDTVLTTLVVDSKVEVIRKKSPETLVIKGEAKPTEHIDIGAMSDDQLAQLSTDRKLSTELSVMQIMRGYAQKIQRPLTDAEIEAIAARTSDHCSHTTFNAELIVDGNRVPSLFSRIKDRSRPLFEKRRVLSAFSDNAGVVDFADGWALNMKGETHISPSEISPRGGAATGAGGVLRDGQENGQGARPILGVDVFATSSTRPDAPARSGIPAKRLLSECIAGVREYGNPMGIATANGSIYEHPAYERSKSVVLVEVVSLGRVERSAKGVPQPNDRVVIVGGRTGRDGIHGATFSSEKMTTDTHEIHADAVQIGNPIVQQKMFEALIEASEAGLIRANTDCGAAGFSSAIGEMAEDIGVMVDISLAPTKYEGLAGWEKWLSESQERAVAAIAPDDVATFMDMCHKHGVEATDIGFFGTPNDEPRLQVLHGDEMLIDLDYDFLNNGFPPTTYEAAWTPPVIEEIVPTITDYAQTLKQILSHTNVCSKEPITRRFDHGVQGMSVLDPYGGRTGLAPSNAAVLQPLLDKPYGAVFAHGLNPSMAFDPNHGSKWAFAEAVANAVAAGADYETLVAGNNYMGPAPTKQVLGALSIQVDTVMDCAEAYGAPIITGKDSNSSSKQDENGKVWESPAVVAIGILGQMEHIENAMTSDLKNTGSVLVLVGQPDLEHLGGTVFYDVAGGSSGHVPRVDLASAPKVSKTMSTAIKNGAVSACHDISHGGLATTVAEMCIGGGIGAILSLPSSVKPENMLFGETAGCFVAEVPDIHAAHETFGDVPFSVIGVTTPDQHLTVFQRGGEVLSESLQDLQQAWQSEHIEEVAA